MSAEVVTVGKPDAVANAAAPLSDDLLAELRALLRGQMAIAAGGI